MIIDLLHHGIPPDTRTDDGRTALHFAANDASAVALINAGASVNTQDSSARCPLHYAASIDVAKVLIHHGADLAARDRFDRQPIHTACYDGRKDIVVLLIESGVSVNAKNRARETPLHISAYQGHTTLISMLLEHGANIHATANDGKTPLASSCAGTGVPEVLKILIKSGANVGWHDRHNYNCLHLAALHENTAAAEILLANQIGVNDHTDEGNTALHFAVKSGNFDLAKLLIQHGAKWSIVNNKGLTVLAITKKKEMIPEYDVGGTADQQKEYWENLEKETTAINEGRKRVRQFIEERESKSSDIRKSNAP